MLECLLVAISGHAERVARASALPPIADVAAVGRESPKLTHKRHNGRWNGYLNLSILGDFMMATHSISAGLLLADRLANYLNVLGS